MYVIRHDYKRVQADGREMGRDLPPATLNDLPEPAQPHLIVDNPPVDAHAVANADRHEVRAGGGVVVLAKPW